MDKYDVSNDQYCYDGTSVLVNKLGITDMSMLEEAEREITRVAIQVVTYKAPPYDLEYLKSLHRSLFGNLYDWAGQIRNVDISKKNTRFCTFSRIVPESEKLFDSLEADRWLSGLSKFDFCTKLAEHYCEFNMIHPFREGNGRTQRLMFEHLALSAGYELDWGSKQRDEWLEANIVGVLDPEPLKNLFMEIVNAY